MNGENLEQSLDLATLIETYYQPVYRYAYRLTGTAADAEDVTQQTFLIAQTKIDQLRNQSAVKGWLFTVARNLFLKSLRDNKETAVPLETLEESVTLGNLEQELTSEELQTVLDELPMEFRMPLILYYLQELSYKEIAAQLEVPIGTVMSRLARAKSVLRKRLSPERSPASE